MKLDVTITLADAVLILREKLGERFPTDEIGDISIASYSSRITIQEDDMVVSEEFRHRISNEVRYHEKGD